MKKKALSLLLTLTMLLSLVPAFGTLASAAEPTGVSYIDENGQTKWCSTYTAVNDTENYELVKWGTKGSTSWYVLSGSDGYDSIEIEPVIVEGNVNLILTDGCDLELYGGDGNGKAGITLRSGANLTVYGQIAGSGKLTAWGAIRNSVDQISAAAILASDTDAPIVTPTVTVVGGTVRADGGNCNYDESEGNCIGSNGIIDCIVNVKGGTLHAHSGQSGSGNGSAGIANCTINVSGGEFGAEGCDARDYEAILKPYCGGAGISNCTLNVTGGAVNSAGGTEFKYKGGNGIEDSSVTISGGVVRAYGDIARTFNGGNSDGTSTGIADCTVNVSGGTLYAFSNDTGDGIGGTTTLNVTGGAIAVAAGTGKQAIGCSVSLNCSSVKAYAFADSTVPESCTEATSFTNRCALFGNLDLSWYHDSSTEPTNSFTVADSNDLVGLAMLVNCGVQSFSGKQITLGSNFTNTNHPLTMPVGAYDRFFNNGIGVECPFNGTFDGNGKAVVLNIPGGSYSYAGLFGYISDGEISDVSVSGTVSGKNFAGGVLGAGSGDITNCSSSCTVNGCDAGGVAGGVTGDVTDCYATGNVSAVGDQPCAGGVVGSIAGSIKNCWATGTVSVRGGMNCYAGGVAGSFAGSFAAYTSPTAAAINCYAAGDVIAISVEEANSRCAASIYAGGAFGGVACGNVINCYATGDVSASSSSKTVATLAEDSQGYSYSCAFSSGLVGQVTYGSIINCYASGNVTSAASCVHDVSVSNYKKIACSAGVAGCLFNGTIKNSYFKSDIANYGIGTTEEYPIVPSNDGCTALSAAQMKAAMGATNADWAAIRVYNVASDTELPGYETAKKVSLVTALNAYVAGSDCETWKVDGSVNDGYPVFGEYTEEHHSGGDPTAYEITVNSATHGAVTADKKSAYSGNTVTLTVKPDTGWTLETLTVKDADGKEISLTAKKLGETYTFRMPASAVTVTATFMEDNRMLNYFTDVKPTDYYYKAVLWAVENGITTAADSLHFEPMTTCDRGQVVTFLYRALGCPKAAKAADFADVPSHWYFVDAIAWAAEKNVTTGTDKGFEPFAGVTRGEVVTFLWRAAGSPAAKSAESFADVPANEYYSTAVAWAVENGITTGGDNGFAPNTLCDRGQIVTFLWRYFVK